MKNKLIILAFASIGLLVLVGCYVEQPRGYVVRPAVYPTYSYVYYPDVEVYYEPHHHIYYWAEGGAWRSGARVPRNMVLRSSVRVDLNSPEPYKHHDEVRARYPRHTDEREHGR